MTENSKRTLPSNLLSILAMGSGAAVVLAALVSLGLTLYSVVAAAIL